MNTSQSRQRAAAAFIARGWPVFPLTPGAKKPLRHCRLCSSKSPDYQPHRGVDDCPHRPDTCHGFHIASTDPERVADWFARYPEMNIGIATGPARLVVVDLDTNKDGSPPPQQYDSMGVADGGDVFALALERYGQAFPSSTLIVGTPSRGLHLYWTLPPGVTVNKSEGAFGWNIDVRATGGYIVAPTSVTTDGEYRRLSAGLDPLAAPKWLLHHLEGTGHMPKPPSAVRPAPARRPTSDRGRTTLADLAAQLAAAPEGQRHRVLCSVTTAAAYLVQAGRCAEADVRAEIHAAARIAQRSENEIHQAIESAFEYVGRRGAA
ncbi:bifunctional DNA primase/polymerase [Streptomyces sp. NRRL F-5123]|uniref:bifunctional DNA primase/polymerase n=1 Tax=Streptomyces sp. NRRL F-5123 TaxID=1463856 RepID=UPI000693F4BD|nr:bifunctional DNA primase/polymerase [Streptomyces sp. NRRL F-5123]